MNWLFKPFWVILLNLRLFMLLHAAAIVSDLDTADHSDLQNANLNLLNLNFNPDIVNPVCSGVYLATIVVQYVPDPFDLTPSTQKLLILLGGNHGKKNVDLVFVCPDKPTNGTGDDDDGIKMVFFTTEDAIDGRAKKGEYDIVAEMEVVDQAKDFIISTPATLGVEINDDKNTSTLRTIMC